MAQQVKTYNLDWNPPTTYSKRWHFEYGADTDPVDTTFECDLKCIQCEAMVGNRKCSRKTCYTLPYCWQHLKSVAKLRIGRTTLVNPANNRRFDFLGLFACDTKKRKGARVFRVNDIITPYIGEVINKDTLDWRYPGDDEVAPYTEDTAGDNFVDGACMRGVATLANDARPGSRCSRGQNCATNALLASAPGQYPVLKALVDIGNGQEIFTEYGDAYWGGDIREFKTTPSAAYKKLSYKC